MKVFHDKYVKLKQNKIVVDGKQTGRRKKRKKKKGRRKTNDDLR